MRFFVTATGTDRGKSFFVASMLAWCYKNSISIAPFKPIQSGTFGGLIAPDVKSYGVDTDTKFQMYMYDKPYSPHLAAEVEGVGYPVLESIKSRALLLEEEFGRVVIEGAGGLMVPIDREKRLTVLDLAYLLDSPVILIVQCGLGAINDALLSLSALKQKNIKTVGFVINEQKNSCDEVIKKDNAVVIEQFSGVPFLGFLPYVEDKNRDSLAIGFEGLSIKLLEVINGL